MGAKMVIRGSSGIFFDNDSDLLAVARRQCSIIQPSCLAAIAPLSLVSHALKASFRAGTSRPARKEAPFVRHFLFVNRITHCSD